MINGVRKIVQNKELRQSSELIMSVIRTLAALAAATTLIVTHWKI